MKCPLCYKRTAIKVGVKDDPDHPDKVQMICVPCSTESVETRVFARRIILDMTVVLTVGPTEKITLGGIGMGPRCTYDLKAMLG